MKTNSNNVLKQNTLDIKYIQNIPIFEIYIDYKHFLLFNTDHHLDVFSDLEDDGSLKLTIRLKSFHSTIKFHTIFSGWDKNIHSIQQFISIFTSIKKIDVKFISLNKEKVFQKSIPIPSSVQEHCKIYIGEIETFQDEDGLQEIFEYLPVGFLAPYANSSYFLLMCKTDDTFFNKIKMIPTKEIQFNVCSSALSIKLFITHQEMTFATLLIEQKDICEEIQEDFHHLLEHKKVYFAITNESMTNHQYLKFSKRLSDADMKMIHTFFFSGNQGLSLV